jgi:hypothetical protein
MRDTEVFLVPRRRDRSIQLGVAVDPPLAMQKVVGSSPIIRFKGSSHIRFQ